jgi:hypothetical protein
MSQCVYDVIVIGAAPAGALLASRVAGAGMRWRSPGWDLVGRQWLRLRLNAVEGAAASGPVANSTGS